MKVLLSMLMLAALAGCATTDNTRFQDRQETSSACVKANNWPNFIRLHTQGEAHVWIKEVDGIPSKSESEVCLSPGEHTLGIRAFNRYDYSSVQVKVLLEPSKRYYLIANKPSMTFHYKLLDQTADPATEILAFSAGVVSSSTPVFIPIVIPPRSK
jgi:hypothetical protein